MTKDKKIKYATDPECLWCCVEFFTLNTGTTPGQVEVLRSWYRAYRRTPFWMMPFTLDNPNGEGYTQSLPKEHIAVWVYGLKELIKLNNSQVVDRLQLKQHLRHLQKILAA